MCRFTFVTAKESACAAVKNREKLFGNFVQRTFHILCVWCNRQAISRFNLYGLKEKESAFKAGRAKILKLDLLIII